MTVDMAIVAKLVRVAMNDFELDTGKIVIDEDILDLLSIDTGLEGFKDALYARMREMGKKLVFRVYRGYDKNLNGGGITVEWRPDE